jgi:hypothetical protein
MANGLKMTLALSLFVARVLTNHPNHAITANDLAFVANLFDGWSNFHDIYLVGSKFRYGYISR